jgi:hypothetical protein
MIKCSCGSENITIEKKYKRTNGPKVTGKRMSYGVVFNRHTCNDCKKVWNV